MPQNEHTEFLKTLCAIDSRTVDGAAGTMRVGEMLGERLQTMGFTLEWVDLESSAGPRRQHLKAIRNPGASTRLVLIGHTDTVLSPREAPFRLDASADRAYGSGVCDMKGGCVVAIEAIRIALAEAESVRQAGIIVLFNCSEELSEPSFPALARNTVKGVKACLGFEPGSLGPDGESQIVVARKGIVRFQLTCRGRAAHAGGDHAAGVSAIRELARKIEQIESLTDYAQGVTANVGHIIGGRVANQVAEEAVAVFEVRAFERDVLYAARDQVREICSEPTVRSASDGTPTRLELSEYCACPPWPPNAWTAALAERYVGFVRARGDNVMPIRRGGASDVNHLADLTPSLDGLGIVGGNLHTTSEWADLNTLPIRARTAADLMVALCVGEVER